MFKKNINCVSQPPIYKYINIKDIIVVSKGHTLEKDFIQSTSTDILGIIVNNDKYINKLNKIGKGSYGHIYQLDNINTSKSNSYVIKKYMDNDDYLVEKILSMILYNIYHKFNIELDVIPSYWNDDEKITIMPTCDDDLYNLVYKNKQINYNPFDIFLQVTRSIYMMINYGIYYCDLKLSNILYNNQEDKINCILGDIGSLIFSKNNLYTNLFWNNDLENNYIQLKKIINTNLCSLELKIDNSFHIIGYTTIPHKLKFEITSSNIFKIVNITDDHVQLESSSKKNIYINEIYYNKIDAIFTFPHLINSDGLIDKLYKLDSRNMENILLNNIFHSLGVLLIELIFKNDFGLRHNQIKNNYYHSLQLIKKKINSNDALSTFNKKILLEILFGTNCKHGLINSTYISYYKVNLEFEDLIKKITKIIN